MNVQHPRGNLLSVDIDVFELRQIGFDLVQDLNEVGLKKAIYHKEETRIGEIEHEVQFGRPVAGIQRDQDCADLEDGKFDEKIFDAVRKKESTGFSLLQALSLECRSQVVCSSTELP